jgi:hypothetical protein
MALGAEAKTVRRMFVWQGGRVALAGIVVGMLAALGLTTYIKTLLFDVGRLDVFAFAGMSGVMLAVALLASYVPAIRSWRCGRNSRPSCNSRPPRASRLIGAHRQRASERRERATRAERAGEAARERACGGVRGAKPLGYK